MEKMLPTNIPYRDRMIDTIARLTIDCIDVDDQGGVKLREISSDEWEKVVRELAQL